MCGSHNETLDTTLHLLTPGYNKARTRPGSVAHYSLSRFISSDEQGGGARRAAVADGAIRESDQFQIDRYRYWYMVGRHSIQ